MAVEALIIENWLFDTLSADQTLAEALATDGRAPFYQIGVYSTIAPLVDPRTGKPPATPYVVYSNEGVAGDDEIALCGQRYMSDPVYRITVWDSVKGAVSWAKLQAVADRIDALVDNQTLATTPPAWGRRLSASTEIEVANDGLIDYGVTQLYHFRVKSNAT
jgi:hypothetical protein